MIRGASPCHYDVLGIPTSSTQGEIRKAFEKLSAVFDADSLALYSLAQPEEQRRALEEIRQAYRVLSNPESRAAYDEEKGYETVRPAPEQKELPFQRAPESEAESRSFSSPLELGDHPPRAVAPSGDVRVVEAAAPAVEAQAAEDVIVLGDEDLVEVEEVEPPVEEPVEEPGLPVIDGDTEFTGALLKAIRESKGLSIRDISSSTRIGTNHLENIEEENFSMLPDRVFLRGFLQSFARELRLDPARVSETYLRRRESGRIR